MLILDRNSFQVELVNWAPCVDDSFIQYSEPGNLTVEQGPATGRSRNIFEGNSLGPPGKLIDHHEDVTVVIKRWQGAHQVNVYGPETPRSHWEGSNGGLDMAGDLGSLAGLAVSTPALNIPLYVRPDETGRQRCFTSPWKSWTRSSGN